MQRRKANEHTDVFSIHITASDLIIQRVFQARISPQCEAFERSSRRLVYFASQRGKTQRRVGKFFSCVHIIQTYAPEG